MEWEISCVRGEIKSYQSSFTTVTINMHELASLKRKTDAPTFGTQVTRALVDSLGGLGSFTKSVVLALTYLLPWLVILAGIGVPTLYLLRRRKGE